MKKKAPPGKAGTNKGGSSSKASGLAGARRGSIAPPLKAKALLQATAIAALQAQDAESRQNSVLDLFRTATGAPQSALDVMKPHAASTTQTRKGAAADIAVACKHVGLVFVLKECGILNSLQRTLFPEGIESLLTRGGGGEADDKSTDGGSIVSGAGGGLKPSTSAVSLTSLISETEAITIATTAANSNNTDSKRGKTTPPTAREGCLLILRALCEIVGKPAEPFIVGAFLAAALDECASANSAVREAAEDTATALCRLAHPWAFRRVLSPILLQSLQCTEWRVKAAALERIVQLSATAPAQVQKLIPTWIPAVTNQVWDTKAQVSKGARAALTAICKTNANKDIAPTIPFVVNAICKPSETNKAVSELMGTTFVVPVDAGTLAILCPLLARALKEKLAVHKRGACIVIANMSKLVETPQAIAPFGSLLVPELQKVAANVQFEEIRDESLKALKSLTKALGDQYRSVAVDGETTNTITTGAAVEPSSTNGNHNATPAASSLTDTTIAILEQEQAEVEAAQLKIQQEREAAAARDAALQRQEEEERRRFKEAMDAQRRLDALAEERAAAAKAQEAQKREMERLNPKTASGKCQSCGLKKCRKSCMFYSG